MIFKKLIRYLLSSAVMPVLLAVPSLGATINLSPGQNPETAITSAHSGDTVIFGAGTFTIYSPIVIPSGVTVEGISPSQSHIVFNLAGGDDSSYGFSIAGNASNVTIQQLDMVSNHGIIQMSLGDPNTDSFNNTLITDNNLQYGGGQLSDGTLVFGIFGSMPNKGLKITHNYLHDSTGVSCRNWCIWGATDSNIDYNVFYNIEDGGQISCPGSNVSFSYNYGTHIHRMGQEAGLVEGSSLTINGNVFYDWVNPYPDSDALSIVGPCGEVDYTNNFFKASIAPGSSWGPPDGGGLNRFGMAIEGTGEPANVTGNTFVGTWACCYSSTMQGANVSNNNVYGGALWGNFDGEPGPYGNGSVNASNNKVDNNVNDAPATPSNTFAGPAYGSSSSNSSSQSSPSSAAAAPSAPAAPTASVSTAATASPAPAQSQSQADNQSSGSSAAAQSSAPAQNPAPAATPAPPASAPPAKTPAPVAAPAPAPAKVATPSAPAASASSASSGTKSTGPSPAAPSDASSPKVAAKPTASAASKSAVAKEEQDAKNKKKKEAAKKAALLKLKPYLVIER